MNELHPIPDLSPDLFDQLKDYVQFTPDDEARLRTLLPVVRPDLEAIADHFYERVMAFPDAMAVFTEGPAQVERLKKTMVRWLETGLSGPHDRGYFEARAKIGQVHVLIGLPQHYMFTAMNVMRVDLQRRVLDLAQDSTMTLEEARTTMDAIDRLLDIELAIMLHTYREDSEKRMRDKERLATIGQLAASIGHDLRNPLGVIESSLFIMRRRAGQDPKLGRHIERISDQVGVCNRIVTDLLEMARNRPPKLGLERVRRLAEAAQSSITLPHGVEVHFDIPDALTLAADAGLLTQALMNLMSNAVTAVATHGDGRGEVWVAAHRDPDDPAWVQVAVTDTGPGFEPRILNRVFEPLFSTRAKGTGLGLALVKSVTERHGGRVRAGNAPGGGAVVRLTLPARPADPVGPSPDSD